MKKIITYLTSIAIGIYLGSAYAQTNTGYYKVEIPNLTLKSPEVKAFERYGEIPVSEYTGTPDIEIPLHVIEEGSIRLPISLNYHATGIQVTQEATWAGLGWNLMAGGCISRIPVGQVDGITNTFDYTSDWTNMMTYKPSSYQPTGGYPQRYNEETYRLWGCISNNSYALNDNVLKNSLVGNGERDVYAVSLAGESFKFSIHPVTKEAVFLGEKKKYKIKQEADRWILTDEKGIKYYFSNNELADINTPTVRQSYTSTWYLTSIEAQDGRVNFFYKPVEEVELLPYINESIETGYPGIYAVWNRHTRAVSVNKLRTQLYLSKIWTNSQMITFTTKNRTDIRKGEALDQITIQNIRMEMIKRYKFNHSYFNGTNRGTNPSNETFITQRLKLESLHEIGNNGEISKYDFQYEEKYPLPYKTSFSQDYWGYYNGQENKLDSKKVEWYPSCAYMDYYPSNRGLVPSYLNLFIGDSIGYVNATPLEIEKADIQRNASQEYMTMGTLKSITYPTGGKTVFEFEPHTFSNHLHPCIEDMETLIYPRIVVHRALSNNNDASLKLNQAVITLKEKSEVNFQATFRSPTYDFFDMYESKALILGNIENAMGMKTIQMDNSQTCNGNPSCDMFKFKNNRYVEKSLKLTIGKGTFAVIAQLSKSIPNQGYDFSTLVEGKVSFWENPNPGVFTQAKKFQSYGGGIRIKKIENYDNNGIRISSRSYNYNNTDGKSSGKLIHPLKFHDISAKTIKIASSIPGSEYGYTGFSPAINSRSSTNMLASSPHACGYVVGYSRVEVQDQSIANDKPENGKTVNEYINVPGSFFNDFLFTDKSTDQYMNGKIIRRTRINTNNDVIMTEKYTYTEDNFEYHYINYKVTDNYIGPTELCTFSGGMSMNNYYAYLGRFVITAYPTNSYTIHLTNREETVFPGKGNVTKTTRYEYDPENYKPRKITETKGDKQVITTLSYPHNQMENDICRTMVERNMFAPVIEESTHIGPVLIENKKTDYALYGNIIEPQSLSIKNEKQNGESRIRYHRYDKFGNPVQITKDDATQIIYLWSYKGQYPVAEIRNATYDEANAAVKSLFPVDDINALSALIMPNEAKLEDGSLQRALPNAQVTTYTYNPLIGMLTQTDSRGVITDYEYDNFNRLSAVYVTENGTRRKVETYDYQYQNR